jgi:RNA recognition motif-containing protein
MSTRLHVGNISSSVLEEDLQSLFGRFGRVEAVEIARDPGSGMSRQFAIVEMSVDADATDAIGRLNFTQQFGRTIGVSRARG